VAREMRLRDVARYVFASALVALGLLLILAAQQSPARAATSDPTGSTCPDGYHWERMSGVGCVQNTLPPNARYSYTSAAICNDGYYAIHEPGPNAFGADPNASYLTACLTQAEWDARNAATPTPAAQGGGGGADAGVGPIDRLVSELVEEGTSKPDERSSGVGGLAATAMLLLSAGGAIAAGGGSGVGQAMGGHGRAPDVMRGGASGVGQGMSAGASGVGQGIVHPSGVGQEMSGGASGVGQGMSGGAGAVSDAMRGGASGVGQGMSGGASGVGQGIVHPSGVGQAMSGGAGSTGVLGGPAALGHAVSAGAGAASTLAAPAAAGLPGIASGAGSVLASGFGLPLPRVEMVQAGLSIFRSMKRVTGEPNPGGYSQAELTLLLGDMAGIAAVASALSPAVGLITLTASGAATAREIRNPQQVLDLLRRNFGRLGYLQGVVDENVSHLDGELADLTSTADPAAVPQPPADLQAMPDAALAAARTEWARRMDAAFDAIAAAQGRLDDLDTRRNNLAHQIDALGDLLGRIDPSGSVPLTGDMAAIVAYGRGWYFGGDGSKMAAALNESFAKSRGAAQRRMRAGGMDAALGLGPGPVPAGTRSLARWALANGVRDGRLAVLEAMAGLERWRGFYDALTAAAQQRLAVLRAWAEAASTVRRDLAAEVSRRAVGGAGG
jgi:hypothetical protein